MNDELVRSPELQQAREVLRAIDPPDGAKERVEQQLMAQMHRPRSRRSAWRWGVGLAFLAATSAAAVSDYSPLARLIHGARPATPVAAPVATVAAPVHVKAPAPPPPPVETAEATEDTEAAPAPEPAISVASSAAPKRASKASGEHAVAATTELPPSELSQMVADYQRARALSERDPEAGLRAFRALQTRWPHSPLEPEIDLQIVALLNRLGQHEASKQQAESFIKEHPDSPRASELKGALGE